MKARRIVWVDIAKFICIACVMNSHLESGTKSLLALYMPFYLTLFFFLSGYVHKNKDNFKEFFFKKVKQLFVPWLVFSVINILLSHVVSLNTHSSLGTDLLWNLFQIRDHGDGLWFVAALFITYIPFYFVIRRYEKATSPKKTYWIVGAGLVLYLLSVIYKLLMNPSWLPWNDVVLPWHLEYIFFAMFFMLLGYLFRNKWEIHFETLNTAKFRWLVWGAYLGVVVINALVDNRWFEIPVDLAGHLLGITAVVSICKRLPENKFVSYIGQNTLVCFAVHGKIFSVMQVVCRKIIPGLYSKILSNVFTSSCFSILFTVVLCVVLIVPIWIINRYLPFLIGRNFSRNKDNAKQA